eukprot:695507-Pyramimonas_sp.AAC.1
MQVDGEEEAGRSTAGYCGKSGRRGLERAGADHERGCRFSDAVLGAASRGQTLREPSLGQKFTM